MKNYIDNFLSFCDNHHVGILNLTMIFWSMATIVLFIFNNNQVELSFCVFVTIFPLFFFLNGYRQSKNCDDTNRRLFTYIFLVYLFAMINTFVVYMISAFVKETSGVEAFILILPMVLFAVIMGFKVFPTAIKKAKLDMKLFTSYVSKKYIILFVIIIFMAIIMLAFEYFR